VLTITHAKTNLILKNHFILFRKVNKI